MNERRDVRVSDGDRQAAVDRLREAMEEGRLNLHEYDDRLGLAYQSVTYGDLTNLFADLPITAPAPPTPVATAAPVTGAAVRRAAAGMPTALRTLWMIWASIVVICLVVWTLTSIGNGKMDDFWPMWQLIPGAILTVVTVGLNTARRR